MLRVFFSKNFQPLFRVQFLSAVNDHLLKNAILVLFTYSNLRVMGFSTEQLVNFAVFLFLLPFLLVSSYSGKIADSYNKVKIIKIIKICEIAIMLVAMIGFLIHGVWLLLFALFGMGVHSAFFGPIKYSILPQYLGKSEVVLANGYIEMGTFIAIIVGQIIGSYFMATNQVLIVVSSLILISLLGYYFTLQMPEVAVTKQDVVYYKNVFKDIYCLYKKVVKHSYVRINMHLISWFWGLGVVYTTQLPLFVKNYLGADAKVYSLILVLLSLGIGIGSFVCAKISSGHVIRYFAYWGMLFTTILSLVLLVFFHSIQLTQVHFWQFIYTFKGIFILLLFFMLGGSFGFYSVTCYNDLQINSPKEILSQIISANNILNTIYMIATTLISYVLLFFTDVWTVIFIMIMCNLGFCFWYKKNILVAADFK